MSAKVNIFIVIYKYFGKKIRKILIIPLFRLPISFFMCNFAP